MYKYNASYMYNLCKYIYIYYIIHLVPKTRTTQSALVCVIHKQCMLYKYLA